MSSTLPETIPEDIKVIEITKPGGPEVLTVATRTCPVPKANEVLIKIVAAGVNRPDILQRQGLYPVPKDASDLPGLEASGIIAAVGANVSRCKIGDEVCALLPGGGYANYAVTDEGQCMRIPHGVSLIDAAGLPETVLTVWANAFDDAALKPGETLLVHGGTSGIGMTAITMAKAWGAKVITTAGTFEKCKYLRTFGVKAAYQYNDDDWATVIQSDEIGGADVVLDMTGGDFFAKNIDCLKPGGRHVSIAFLRGPMVQINLMAVMQKGLKISGSMLRPRSNAQKTKLCRAVEEYIWPLFAAGKISSITNKTFKLEQVAEAHAYMESGEHVGKILLLT